MITQARAPIGLLSLGGWTTSAVAEYGTALTLAVASTIQVTLRTDTGGARIRPVGTLSPLLTEIAGRLLRAVRREYQLSDVMAEISLDDPAMDGPAVEAALTIAFTAASATIAGLDMPPHHLVWVAHRLREEALSTTDNIAEILAAVSGGVALHRVAPYPRAASEIVPCRWEMLENRLLMVRTGRPASPGLWQRVSERGWQGETTVHRAFWRLRTLADRAAHGLRTNDTDALTECFEEQSALYELLAPALRSPEVHRIRTLAHDAGAACLVESHERVMLLCPPASRLALLLTLNSAGYPTERVTLARTGVEVTTSGTVTQPVRHAVRN